MMSQSQQKVNAKCVGDMEVLQSTDAQLVVPPLTDTPSSSSSSKEPGAFNGIRLAVKERLDLLGGQRAYWLNNCALISTNGKGSVFDVETKTILSSFPEAPHTRYKWRKDSNQLLVSEEEKIRVLFGNRGTGTFPITNKQDTENLSTSSIVTIPLSMMEVRDWSRIPHHFFFFLQATQLLNSLGNLGYTDEERFKQGTEIIVDTSRRVSKHYAFLWNLANLF